VEAAAIANLRTRWKGTDGDGMASSFWENGLAPAFHRAGKSGEETVVASLAGKWPRHPDWASVATSRGKEGSGGEGGGAAGLGCRRARGSMQA